MKKKIIRVVIFIVLILLSIIIGNQVYRRKHTANCKELFNNFEHIKNDMTQAEVKKIMGNPTKIYWLNKEDQHDLFFDKLKKVLVFNYHLKYYFFLNDCDLEIWFDEKGERVVNLYIPMY